MDIETKLGGLAKTSKLNKAIIYMIMCKKYVGIIFFYRALLKTVRLLSKSWATAQKIAPNPRHAINGTNYMNRKWIYSNNLWNLFNWLSFTSHQMSCTFRNILFNSYFIQNLIETFVHNNILKVHKTLKYISFRFITEYHNLRMSYSQKIIYEIYLNFKMYLGINRHL